MTPENQINGRDKFLSPEAIETLNAVFDATKSGTIIATANETGGVVIIKKGGENVVLYDSSGDTS